MQPKLPPEIAAHFIVWEKRMNRISLPILLGAVALLSACSNGNPELSSPEQTRKALAEMKGPDVDGIDKTLLANAHAAENEGNYPRAVTFYQQIVDRTPDKLEYRMLLANALRKGDSCNDALPVYESIVRKDKGNAEAMEGKGLCLMSLGAAKEAGQVFTEVLAIDPSRWRTLNAVGILFAGRGKVDEAIAYFERAASIDSMQLAVNNNLGLVYMLDKRYDQAIETFRNVQRRLPSRSPDKARIDMNLALAYALSGDMDQAQKLASPHVSDAGLYNNMGFFAKLAKDETLARDYLNMALSKSPTYYPRAWENLNGIRNNPQGGLDDSHGVKVRVGQESGARTTRPAAPKAQAEVAKAFVAAPVAPEPVVAEPVAAVVAPKPVPVEVATQPVIEMEFEPVAATATEVNEAASELETAANGEAKRWKELTPRSDESLRAPEATFLRRIEQPEENLLAPKTEGWME
jgi:Flp pilus assembly protein TadD